MNLNKAILGNHKKINIKRWNERVSLSDMNLNLQ